MKKKNDTNHQKKRSSSSTASTTHSKAKHKLGGGSKRRKQKGSEQESSSSPVVEAERWSKSKKKRMRKMKFAEKKREGGNNTENDTTKEEDKEMKDTASSTTTTETLAIGSNDDTTKDRKDNNKPKQSALQKSFLSRLSGSRFRELNEDLYTTTSQSAFEKFSKQPEFYDQYHEGFRRQVKEWPINPVNVIAEWLVSRKKKSADDTTTTVVDFGCGDAALAKKLNKKKQFEVHSFDLVASCVWVTACDMAHVPIPTGSVDVAIFCLSLMGTNLADFVREAHRVLKPATGILKIAEVRSRFFDSNSDNDKCLKQFLKTLSKLGFKCIQKDDESNKMFIMLELVPNGKKPDPKLAYTAKPCLYKRR